MRVSKSRAGKAGRKSSEAPIGPMWDKPSLQEFDGTANTNAGTKGKEPGGRWSQAYYETPAVVISPSEVRKP